MSDGMRKVLQTALMIATNNGELIGSLNDMTCKLSQ